MLWIMNNLLIVLKEVITFNIYDLRRMNELNNQSRQRSKIINIIE